MIRRHGTIATGLGHVKDKTLALLLAWFVGGEFMQLIDYDSDRWMIMMHYYIVINDDYDI